MRIVFKMTWVILFCALAALAQDTATSLQISGDVEHPLTLSPAQLMAMSRAKLQVPSGDKQLTYEGVWLYKLLEAAGAPLGGALRGKALATYVSVTAADGYRVVFSLAELDPSFSDSQVLVADTLDGKPLSPDGGPTRLIVPKDKPGARWVRRLTKIEVVRLSK